VYARDCSGVGVLNEIVRVVSVVPSLRLVTITNSGGRELLELGARVAEVDLFWVDCCAGFFFGFVMDYSAVGTSRADGIE
jgi:hypothetical protein